MLTLYVKLFLLS